MKDTVNTVMEESLSAEEHNPASVYREQGMTGGMLDYDNTFNEMLAKDTNRVQCRIGILLRCFLIAPILAQWLMLLWSFDHGYVEVTDSHNGTHKIHIDHTHQFTVRQCTRSHLALWRDVQL